MYWNLCRQFKSKKFLWVICKILGRFVNPLTADDKYSLLNRGDLLQHVQIQLSKKRKIFFEFFLDFLNLNSIFNIFEKKNWPSHLMYFSTYRLRNTWLDKCLKTPVSEDLSTSNMINETKHCSKLNDITFTIFIHPCEGYSPWKSLWEWYAKS